MTIAQTDPRLLRTLRTTSQMVSLVVVAVSCGVLIGWGVEIQTFKSILPGWVTMKPNTALGLLLSGLALGLLHIPGQFARRLSQGCACAVVVLGGLTLSQDLGNWDLGIDQLLFPDDLNPVETADPGRMSPIAAFNLTLTGAALWLLTWKTGPYRLVQGLSLMTGLISLQVLVGYIYGVEPLSSLTAFTSTAIHTALMFLLLSLGVWFAGPTQGWMNLVISRTAGGITARVLLPAAVVIPFGVGWLQILGERTELFDNALGLSLHVTGNIVAFAGLIGYCTKRLYQIDMQRQQAEADLRAAHNALGARVEQRTAELSQANQALQQSEERFRCAILDAPLPIMLHTEDQEVLQVNHIWTEITGYRLEDIPTINVWLEKAYGERKEAVQAEILRNYPLTDRIAMGEYTITTRTGETRIWDFYAAPLHPLPDGRKLVIATAIDVTERRQAEAERNQFFTLSLDLLCIAGVDGYFKQLNPAWTRTLGYTEAELMSQPYINFVHLEDRQRTQVEAKDHAAGSPSLVFENRYRCKDGSYKWLSWTSVANPEKGLMYAAARDVTEQKQAETSLQTLNQELHRLLAESETLLEVIPIGIGIAEDPDCQKIRVNPAFAQQLGIPTTVNASLSAPQGERPSNFKVYQHGRELAPEELPLQYAAARGVEVRDFEVDVVWNDGTVITLLEYAAPLFDEQGSVRGSVGAFLDITERKQADDQVRQLNATLEQRVQERTAQLTEVNQELKRFNYTVSHDLRSPLRAIRGLIEALGEDYHDRLDETGQEYIRYIADSARRMDTLIQDLLAYSRLTQTQIQLQTVDLDALLQEVLSQLEPERQAKQAEITVKLPLPRVVGQRTILTQVLINLLSNAIEYVEPNISPRVQVWAEQRQNRVRIWVADNGIGIDPEYQAQIFGVFERLHSAETYTGTGIGLAIVQKGIERMGGEVGVESQLGQGSRFWIELPLA